MANKTKLVYGLPREAEVGQIAAASNKGRNAKKHFDLVTQGLRLGYPAGQTPELTPADPVMETQMILTIDEIHTYENNPRRSSPNPRYQEIKDSIRNSSLHNPISITRRPGDNYYIVESGGNTRLTILRELWEETKDEKFYRLSFVYKPWQRESVVLAKHIIENNVRGDMSFWDNAISFMELRAQLEEEQGSNISLRQFEELLKKQGVSCSKSEIALFMFATERLKPLGRALPLLTARLVIEIQPRFNLYKRLFEKYEALNEASLYAVLDPVMSSYGNRFFTEDKSSDDNLSRFNPEDLIALCDEAVAAECDQSVSWLLTVLDGLKFNPNADMVSLYPQSGSQDNLGGAQTPASGGDDDNHQATPLGEAEGHEKAGKKEPCPPATKKPAAPQTQEGRAGVTEPTPLLDRILANIYSFAEGCGVSSMAISQSSDLPFGFWIEPIDLDATTDALQHIGWWALASTSGQINQQVISLLPSAAAWRRVAGTDEEKETLTTMLGGTPDFLYFHQDWVLDQFSGELFEIYIQIIKDMRQFRELAPHRFDVDKIEGQDHE